jgi:hypothetical protein
MENMAEGKKLKKMQNQKETEIWKTHHAKREIKQYERNAKWKEKKRRWKNRGMEETNEM